jgi:hypothetical protein
VVAGVVVGGVVVAGVVVGDVVVGGVVVVDVVVVSTAPASAVVPRGTAATMLLHGAHPAEFRTVTRKRYEWPIVSPAAVNVVDFGRPMMVQVAPPLDDRWTRYSMSGAPPLEAGACHVRRTCPAPTPGVGATAAVSDRGADGASIVPGGVVPVMRRM